jgi:hypothetical protein
MTRMTAAQIVSAALTEQPGQTAKELGVSNVTMLRLEADGKVVRLADRRTGQRGRPAIVWGLPGQEIDTDAEEKANVEAAKQRLAAYRRYERLSSTMMRAYHEYGYMSPEHKAAKDARKTEFPTPPATPSKNDYVLAGEITLAVEPEIIEDDTDVLVAA